jgi:hypothetical protein
MIRTELILMPDMRRSIAEPTVTRVHNQHFDILWSISMLLDPTFHDGMDIQVVMLDSNLNGGMSLSPPEWTPSIRRSPIFILRIIVPNALRSAAWQRRSMNQMYGINATNVWIIVGTLHICPVR